MIIPARFNGPAGSAHGGVACGTFAAAVDPRAATVRLLNPPPLDTELDVHGGDPTTIASPAGPVAIVRPATGDAEAVGTFGWLDDEAMVAARLEWVEHTQPHHPFPTCFGCGHQRPEHDGLALFAGAVPGTDLSATYWTPPANLAAIPDWLVWAALDCPSGAVTFRHLPRGTPVVLGELSVWIDRTPRPGERCQVISRTLGVDGRRLPSEVGLIAPDGSCLARGRAIWFALATHPGQPTVV